MSKIQCTTSTTFTFSKNPFNQKTKATKVLLKETKASKSIACTCCQSFDSLRAFVCLLNCIVLFDTILWMSSAVLLCYRVYSVQYSTCMLRILLWSVIKSYMYCCVSFQIQCNGGQLLSYNYLKLWPNFKQRKKKKRTKMWMYLSLPVCLFITFICKYIVLFFIRKILILLISKLTTSPTAL